MPQSKPTQTFQAPKVGAPQIRLLERLSNAVGVTGDESEVRKIVLEQVRPIVDERGRGSVKVDALGNVLVNLPGTAPEPRLRVMLDAHMDEVGFMLTNEEEKGIFRFTIIGGVDPRQLPGKPVLVGKDHTPGVIGAKPIHLTKREEIKSPISVESLRIDVGLNNANLQVGDRGTFATTFTRLGPSVRGKALDNRLGVSILIELVRHAPENIDLLAAFTTQEEIGGRGARVAAYAFNPDLAIVIDSTPAYDQPVWEEEDGKPVENSLYNSRLGAGPAIYLADNATLSDPRLIRHLVSTAEEYNIPFQFRQPGGGGTDAGAIHRQRAGIPSVSVSVPGRYHHTAVSLARISDWQNTLALVQAALERLPADILSVAR